MRTTGHPSNGPPAAVAKRGHASSWPKRVAQWPPAVAASGRLHRGTVAEGSGETQETGQRVGWMLADSATELFAARWMLYKVAWEEDAGRATPKELHTKASMCKLYASEMVGRVADRVVQIFGGRGYCADYAAERLYRDVRVDRIWEGTSEIMRAVIVNGIMKRDLAGLLG